MLSPPFDVRPHRRSLLFGIGGWLTFSGSLSFAASDFWNRKQSSEWSADEIDQLRNKSPWSKKVRSEIAGSGGGPIDRMDRPGSKGSFGGMSGADSNGLSNGGGGTRGGQPSTGLGGPAPIGGSAGTQGPEVVISWESAKPILEATKFELPPSFEDHYAVSITGMPPQTLMAALTGGGRDRRERSAEPEAAAPEDPAARQKAAVDRLLAGTTLTAKGQAPLPADVLAQSHDKQSVIFGFRKQNLQLTANDKDVTFAMNLRLILVKAKFDLKQMLYRGTLAL